MTEDEDIASHWRQAMLDGSFEEAWRQVDRLELPRREAGSAFVRRPGHLLWNGTDFADRNVVVRCLHGLGDTVQFMRFLPQVGMVARSLHVLAQPSLIPLLAGDGRFGEVHNAWTEWRIRAEVECEIMELAYALRVQSPDVGHHVPYLHCKAVAPIALSHDTLNVGMVWASSNWKASRSVPLAVLTPLFEQDFTFLSLQQDPDRPLPPALRDVSPMTADILGAAACMQSLDLIITVDTFAAHLAGALGRPVWLLLEHRSDWRWMRDRDDSPWYPTMRLFRQPRAGDWRSVVGRLIEELSAFNPARV